jgi:hypothetical protein
MHTLRLPRSGILPQLLRKREGAVVVGRAPRAGAGL